jgi:hypothetical protein
MIVEVAKVAGLHALQMGDRFDIVATMPIDKHHAPPARNMRGPDSLQSAEPEVRVIVDDGTIVSPVRLRTALGTATSLTKGQRTSAKSVEEVVIAVDPAEIPELTAAMSREASITAVARSGHPDDAQVESVTPDSKPVPPPTAIETVVGTKRETIFFPTADDAPALDEPPAFERERSPRLEPKGHPPLPVVAPRVQTRQTRVIQPGSRSADTRLGSRRNSASFADRPADRVLP